jgi:glycosyltransferase involved in cell wall biosynthesis
MPLAKVLLESAREHHPEASIYLCLADSLLSEEEFYPEQCTVIPADELDIPDFENFAFRYDVMEFNTALKPFMIQRLLALGHKQIIYFDPDIQLFRPLEGVLAALQNGASFVLTPHICEPAEEVPFPDDLIFMRAGIFNLGFVAVGSGLEAHRLLRWWARRLLYQCVNDQPNGVFVDQKFMDLMPAFADRVHILRDTTMNVAYWNLAQRLLSLDDDGTWRVDGRPLSFFHYSGFDPKHLSSLSRHTTGFSGPEISQPLSKLMVQYSQRLLTNGHGAIPAGLYAYGKFRSGTIIPDFIRRIFRDEHSAWSGNPFENFEEYLGFPARGPWQGGAGPFVTKLMSHLHDMHPWLKRTYDPNSPSGAPAYIDWLLKHGGAVVGDLRLIEPALERYGNSARPLRTPPAKRLPGEPDIDVIGYLRLASGVGEAGRLALRALERADIHVRGVGTSLGAKASESDTSCEHLLVETSRAPIQVFSINSDQLSLVIDHLSRKLRSDSYRIIVPFWELSQLPDAWLDAYDLVDEVWAPTRFIQQTLMKKIRKPVIRMPLMLNFEPPAIVQRSRFNLPRDTFLFFFAFDYLSFVERKHPQAIVEAFKIAFRRPGSVRSVALVIKTMNSENAPVKAQALRAALEEDPDVILIEQTLTRDMTLGLIGACDAVISLHRSEGLGLLIAEAMVLGKPVISTDYSATTELVNPLTGYPVDYKLIPVQGGDYPFAEGQVWADADVEHAAWQMREVFKGGASVSARVEAAKLHIRTSYGETTIVNHLKCRLQTLGQNP